MSSTSTLLRTTACAILPVGGVLWVWACLPTITTDSISYCGDGYVDEDAGEACDPGTLQQGLGNTACLGSCKVACDIDAGGRDLVGACYFPILDAVTKKSRRTREYDEARTFCSDKSAHVLSIGSEAELQNVGAQFNLPNMLQRPDSLVSEWFWLSLRWVGNRDMRTEATGWEFTQDAAVPVYTSDGLGEPGAAGTFTVYPPIVDSDAAISSAEDPARRCVRGRFVAAPKGQALQVERVPCKIVPGIGAKDFESEGPVALCERPAAGSREKPCPEFGGPMARLPKPIGVGEKRDLCFTIPEGGGQSVPLRKVYRLVRVRSKFLKESAPATIVPESFCAERGARLAVIENRFEREQLWREMREADPGVERVWIGLSFRPDAGTEGAWIWSDGREDDENRGKIWGEERKHNTRAFLQYSGPEFDSQLARTDPGETIQQGVVDAYTLCEYPPNAPAPGSP